ncbi:uncharacterized protein E0L32_001188 [Thyridium curvatum]|uniref:Alternative oxidase n=1 Tax=Thyridium curvatum TaxID=1093900 RepID=A0A507B442_9PEZI|nr:uncharacterized protein E0L32_001188 [Thyridium curvatum]TPX11370.1 hypothetical protein E0L32_001188 [Thyridium curvatum]
MGLDKLIQQQLAAGCSSRRLLTLPVALVLALFLLWTARISFGDSFPSLAKASSSVLKGPPQPPPVAGGGGSNVNYPPPPVDLSQPDAPFVGWPLQRVCNEAHWVDGLVFVCDNNSGGIGNVRNYIQTCIRYAIEAGATGLVVPRIRQRSDKDLADLFTDFLPFNYMFDEDHFRTSMTTFCPQMTLYSNLTDIPSFHDAALQVEEIKPKDMVNKHVDWQDFNRHTDHWGDVFRKWLFEGFRVEGTAAEATPDQRPRAPTVDKPRIIRFKWGVLWDWPVYRDGPEFATTFGSILKFHPELMYLGKQAVKSLHRLSRENGDPMGHFLGMHLRSESDSMGFWPQYEDQNKAYLDKAREKGYKTAYLATGNATEGQKLADGAQATLGMKVWSKTDLLEPQDLEKLQALTWDQQGVVDFIVLLASEYFVGVMPSSFSVYMTIKRHLKMEGIYSRPYKVGTEGDGRSYLVGKYDEYYGGWLFMFDGMWP